jgi:class 3 adenylate cyclase
MRPITVDMKERYLAIVLLDIIGSTAFVQKNGAHVAAQWFQVHDRMTRSLVYKYQGREIDRSDGFLLSFERTIDAVNFALAYQDMIPAKLNLNSRIGIHWGKIVEVKQDDLFVGAGAKRVELEGLSKNIAARTMSLCQAKQILLTKEAVINLRKRINGILPKGTRYVCVGLYRFKGVREPQEVYAVGKTIESLQPPPSSEKVKRIGGPRKIKSRMRDRKLKEHLWWAMQRLAVINLIYMIALVYPFLSNPSARKLWGVDHYFWWVDYISFFIEMIKEAFSKTIAS